MTEKEKNLKDLDELFKAGMLNVDDYAFQREQLKDEMARESGQAVSVPPPIQQETTSPSLEAAVPPPLPATKPVNSLGCEMVHVPGGSFQMGDTAGGGEDDEEDDDNEEPVHKVKLSAFSIGKYEVTQALYESVMGNNPSKFRCGDLPVENVTWYDAIEFCNKLSEKEGVQPVYTIRGRSPATGYPITRATVTIDWSKNGYRLPTEAQWEYAAKGGNGSPGNYTYAGSNDVNNVAWYKDNSGNTSHAVGTKAPNGLGIYDMSGNVFEWCWDWYGDYSSGAQTNPVGASSGSLRVLRGGNWCNPELNARSSYRNAGNPSSRFNSMGFRVLRPAQ